jgi:L-alanine-DL-glutamate epimerase-like enolase superfamily enzyme
MSLRGGPHIWALKQELSDLCWPALTEAAFEPGRIWSALARCRSRGVSPPALAALDIALHDLAARAAEVPVWRLLGAERSAPVRCNATLPAANPSGLLAAVERWRADGFRTFKLKVGLPGDVVQVTSVREELGPDARIRLDANGSWSTDEAITRLRALARSTIELVEEPVRGLEQMALVRGRTRIPLAADESVNSARDARRAVELGACSLATLKLAKVGGIAAALEIAAEFPVYLSSALEGPVGIAAAAHAAQALPDRPVTAELAHGLATERLFAETVGSGAALHGDELVVGEQSGLGVSIDEEALAARRLA